MTRLLDALASDAALPIGIVASGPERLVPALSRFPSALCVTVQPWRAPDLALLPAVAAFVGVRPAITPLSELLPQSLQTALWFDPGPSQILAQVQLVAACLAPNGRLAVVIVSTRMPPAALPVLRLRRALRQAGLLVAQTTGYLGPVALAWSARARLAQTANRPDHYDRYHAAMRAAYAERWPMALLCRTVVVVGTAQC
jgi:hypothetical protein